MNNYRMKPGVYRFDIPTDIFINGKRLKQANAEATRLGFSRRFGAIEDIPDIMGLPISRAMLHYSGTGHRNVRLSVGIPPRPIASDWQRHIPQISKTLAFACLDITGDTWAALVSAHMSGISSNLRLLAELFRDNAADNNEPTISGFARWLARLDRSAPWYVAGGYDVDAACEEFVEVHYPYSDFFALL